MTLDEAEKVARAVNVAEKLDPSGGSVAAAVLAEMLLDVLPVSRAALALSAANVIDDGAKRISARRKAEDELRRTTWALEEKLGMREVPR